MPLQQQFFLFPQYYLSLPLFMLYCERVYKIKSRNPKKHFIFQKEKVFFAYIPQIPHKLPPSIIFMV